jgi:hypothetical protein
MATTPYRRETKDPGDQRQADGPVRQADGPVRRDEKGAC